MTTRAPDRPPRVEWDEDRRQLTDKEAGKMNLSFSTDDEFYKATRDALPWTDPDSDGLGADPGRMLIPATWVECYFVQEITVPLSELQSPAQGPFKFLTRCLHLDKYINPNLDLLIEQGLLRTSLPGAPEQTRHFQDKTELFTASDKMVAELKDEASLTVVHKSWDWTNEYVRAQAQTPATPTARARAQASRQRPNIPTRRGHPPLWTKKSEELPGRDNGLEPQALWRSGTHTR